VPILAPNSERAWSSDNCAYANRAGRKRRVVVALVGILLVYGPYTSALNPSLDANQYAHTAWTVRGGFFNGTIEAIAQTPDGYLWLGTEFGLLRFDGVRSVPWQPPAGERLPSSSILSLLAARDGRLWIGTAKGLASWKDGKLTHYPELAAQNIFALPLLEDRDGTIWAGGYGIPNGRLCAIQDGSSHCFGKDGALGTTVGYLYEDGGANLWVGASTGLWRWKPGPPKLYPMPGPPPGISGLIEDGKGALLIAMRGGIRRLVEGKSEAYPLSAGEQPSQILRDRNGGLWIGTLDRGLVHVHQGRTDRFDRSDGLSGNFVYGLYEDREGNVWVTTSDGLDRFSDVSVPTISVKQGLSNASVGSVLAARDGSIWLGTRDGLNRWNDGQVTIYRKRNSGLPDDMVGSLFQEDGGRIWVSTYRGLAYFENGRFVTVSAMPGGFMHSIAGDSAGNVWISHSADGLFHLFGGSVVERIPWTKLGTGDHAIALITEAAGGGLWLGFRGGGIKLIKDGQVRASYSSADGLGEGAVFGFQLDRDGTLWAATEGGLSRVKNGRIATLTSKNGLLCDTVLWVVEDDAHSFWLYTACGLVRIARPELDAWASDPKRTIQVTVFDTSDGVRSRGDVSGSNPGVAKSSDGKLWFLPGDGVSVLDPSHLALNKLPPPVHIEQITADDKKHDAKSPFRLPPLVRNLTIDFISLSLVAPEKNRYRYKLEGWDRDWREAVDELRIEYSNLPPKHYRFRVIACNNSGVWNEVGDSLDFDIPPAWYQKNWFRVLCAAAFFLLLWAVYQLRVHELREQEKKFREAVETMPALAFVADPLGSRPFVNRGWLEYTGMSPENAYGSGWEKAIHPDDLKRILERWRTAWATGQPLAYESRIRRGSDGTYRWFQTRARPLLDRRGNVVKWCAVATDIEDSKRAEQLQADLAHVSRVSTMGELAASISHELNQPIAASILNANLAMRFLERNPPDLTKVRERAAIIIEVGTMASQIIDRLRSLYKKEPPKREPLVVNEVIGEMVELLRGQATRYAVSLRADLSSDLPNVIADRVQVQQVLMNLILNGIEAMSDTGGVLTVRSQLREDGQIEISVNDTGPGLPEGKTDQIFDAFFTTKPQGSGMGLAISKSIVESHGGRIWANGTGGSGATFHFTLPPAPVEADTPIA